MIYLHKRTQVKYKVLMPSWDTSRQEPHIVYMSMETGEVFNRSLETFNQNFEFVSDPQPDIIVKDAKKDEAIKVINP